MASQPESQRAPLNQEKVAGFLLDPRGPLSPDVIAALQAAVDGKSTDYIKLNTNP